MLFLNASKSQSSKFWQPLMTVKGMLLLHAKLKMTFKWNKVFAISDLYVGGMQGAGG